MIKDFFFFFQRKASSKWRKGGRGPSLSLLFPGNESPSSSLNSGAHLRFHSVLSKTIYLMGNGAGRQNRVEAISDNPGHPTSVRWPERDRAPQIIPVSGIKRLSLPGSFPPHEVQPNTNYRIWSLFSKQSDGLVRRDPTEDNVDCKGAFSDKTGRCSLCFNFLFSFFFFFFFFLRFGICLSYTIL